MFPSGLFGGETKSVQAQQTEENLRFLLTSDEVQVISSFELNQIASLTFHESSIADGDDLCEVVFDVLERVLSKPSADAPLNLLKALVVTQHVMIFGAERVVHSGIVLGRHIEALQTYNTVLLAQQQQTASGIFMRIKGGGVDKGGPVREKATELNQLLSNAEKLRFERTTQADPNSLVPVGDVNKAAFVSDEVRLYALRKRMEHQQLMQTKSNLAKASGGFGGGYNSRDGSSVVGAAHGLDEMIQLAQQKERQKKNQFTDDPSKKAQPENPILSEPFSSYVAPSLDHGARSSSLADQPLFHQQDLLFSMQDSTQQDLSAEVDLLDLGGGGGGATAAESSYSHDLLGVTASPSIPVETNLLGTTPVATAATTTADLWSTGDLLGTTTTSSSATLQNNLLGTSSLLLNQHQPPQLQERHSVSPPPPPPPPPPQQQQRSIMGSPGTSRLSGNDPFAALNALSGTTTTTTTTTNLPIVGGGIASTNSSNGSALAAEHRIMANGVGFGTMTGIGETSTSSSSAHSIHNNSLSGLSPFGTVSPEQTGYPGVHTTTTPAYYQQSLPAYQQATTLKVCQANWGGGGDADDDDENGFVMGGTTGAGLVPVGAPPTSPPPPPPPPPNTPYF